MKRMLVCLAAFLVLSGCAAKDSLDDARGRGDAPVGSVDDTRKDVIQFPDRFSNVSHACDGHGHRVFVTTKSDASRFMVVVADTSCGGATTTGSAGATTTTLK
jgi:hypothetical protein